MDFLPKRRLMSEGKSAEKGESEYEGPESERRSYELRHAFSHVYSLSVSLFFFFRLEVSSVMSIVPVFAALLVMHAAAAGIAGDPLVELYVNCSLPRDLPPIFASISSAQLYIRSHALMRNSSVSVFVDGICRPGSEGAAVNFLSSLDVDSTGAHTLSFKSWLGPDRPAVLSGEIVLDPSRWNPVDANEDLVQLSLTSLEVGLLGPAGFGKIGNGQLGQCTTTKVELFSMSQPMILARYPNPTSLELYNGPWMNWMHVSPLTTEFPKPNSFLFESSRCQAWVGNYSAQQVWVHGFWSFDWADNYIRVLGISISSHTSANHPNLCRIDYDPATPPVYGILAGARFYLLNLPTELDFPGEYFIDEAAATITLFRPSMPLPVLYLNAASGASLVSQSADVTVTGLSFEGFELRFARSMGLLLGNVKGNVTLSAMTVHSMGSTCASISGAGVTISQWAVSRCGCSGISISGGNQQTLQPANIIVQESTFTQYSRWTRTYNPGISFYGVGFLVHNNSVFDAPHQGMTGSANNAYFLGNYFAHLCFEVRDSSAWYIGRSWVHRGVVVANNVFEHIQALEPTALGSDCVSGIYLDDQQSGVTVVNNTCNDVFNCILLGGGRDNALLENHCANVTTCVLFDNRGMNWESDMCTYNATYTGQLVGDLFAVHYQQPPYSIEYPELPGLLSDRPCVPVNNSLIGNTFCIAPGGFVDQTNATVTSWGSRMINNTQRC
jgi:hypothetical protein